MENTAALDKHTFDINWKEVLITSGIVVIGGSLAFLGAMVLNDMYKEHKAKKASEKKDDAAKK